MKLIDIAPKTWKYYLGRTILKYLLWLFQKILFFNFLKSFILCLINMYYFKSILIERPL
jgi:hypothetical protein